MINTTYNIASAIPLGARRIRLRYRDGFEGDISVARFIEAGGVFSFLRDPAQFSKVLIGEDGRWLYWVDPEGDEVDLCADALRYEAEERAVDAMAAAE